MFITDALHGHEKGFHATGVIMACPGSTDGVILHVCLSVHKVPRKKRQIWPAESQVV